VTRLIESLSRRARRARMRRFVELMRVTAETFVLDVGGTPDIWDLAPVRPRVVFLNEPREEAPSTVHADGCRLPFRDGAFDVVFSNSVIEHVGGPARQKQFASEVARVGRGFWVQTPNRRFPVELHLLTPFVHWLPRRWQRWMVPRFTVWSLLVRAAPDRREFFLRHYLDSVRLLSSEELAALFPGARLLKSPKSLVAYRASPWRAAGS
jgi:SAM-dependent methyltransferase